MFSTLKPCFRSSPLQVVTQKLIMFKTQIIVRSWDHKKLLLISKDRGWTHVSCGSCTADRFFTAESQRKPLVPWPGITSVPPAFKVWSLNHWTTRKSCCIYHMLCLVAESCPTLCNSMVCSSPGFSVPGTLQRRMLD